MRLIHKEGSMNISQFFQATPNVILFQHAPIWFCKWYLSLLGSLYYIVNRREHRVIEQNIKMVFKENGEVKTIVRKTFRGIFTHYAEKLIMAHRKYSRVKQELGQITNYSGLDNLDAALKKGGVILVTAHLGGVEFMPLALALRKYPATMVVRFQTARLKESLMKRAEEVGVELIDSESENVLQKAMDSLKKGRILLTECDEIDAWKPLKNNTINAFGCQILLDRSLEVMCRRSGSTVLGSFMIRRGGGYELTIVPFGDERKIASEGLAAVILKTFEQIVMMFPDQWYQWKKFHKMRPEMA